MGLLVFESKKLYKKYKKAQMIKRHYASTVPLNTNFNFNNASSVSVGKNGILDYA